MHSKSTLARQLIRSVTLLMIALVAVSFCMPPTFAGSKTKKSTVYSQVIVKGKYAYCASKEGLYRVNVKTGSKTRFYDDSDPYTWVGDMKIYKGYMYFTTYGSTFNKDLYRVKLNGGKLKWLAAMDRYAISGGRLYYDIYKPASDKYTYKKMKLNGKSKKSSSYKIRMKFKESNKSGYGVVSKNGCDYLKLPGGKKIKIAKVTTLD